MKMSLVVDGLRSDVISVGELGDESVAEAADRIAEVLGRSIPSRVLDLLSEVAAELSAELPDGRVEIRVAGDDVDLAYVSDDAAGTAGSDVAGDGDRARDRDRDRDMSARITLRLSESLKTRVEEGAARQGISVNAFIVRTLEHGASGEHKRKNYAGNRLRGYGTT
ncbi:MAG TPA: toxin-antitoxin system HicB family antitoxin [Acidimicrobiales bacterium]